MADLLQIADFWLTKLKVDITKGNLFGKNYPKRIGSRAVLKRNLNLKKLLLGLVLLSVLVGTAHAQSVLIRWNDNSEDEEGFFVERTVSKDCASGWQVIAYTARDQNFLRDVFIPGACYRAAAYNNLGSSPYSNSIRMPLDSETSILQVSH